MIETKIGRVREACYSIPDSIPLRQDLPPDPRECMAVRRVLARVNTSAALAAVIAAHAFSASNAREG